MQGRLWLPLGRTATISPVADTVTYIICMTLRSSSAANWFASCSWREGRGRRGRARQWQPRATYRTVGCARAERSLEIDIN